MIHQELRRAFSSTLSIIVNPRNHSENLGVWRALAFYYKALPVPLFMVLLISCLDLLLARSGTIAPTFWSPSLSNASGSGSSGSISTPLYPIVYLLTYPVAGLLNAAIFHGIAKMFRIWKGSYARTLTAVTYGLLPTAMGIWVLSIPLANLPVAAVTNLLFLMVYFWNARTTILSFEVQHEISRGRALIGFIAGFIVIFFTMTFYYNFTITMTITKNTIEAIFG